jgi:hypothetical protein
MSNGTHRVSLAKNMPRANLPPQYQSHHLGMIDLHRACLATNLLRTQLPQPITLSSICQSLSLLRANLPTAHPQHQQPDGVVYKPLSACPISVTLTDPLEWAIPTQEPEHAEYDVSQCRA